MFAGGGGEGEGGACDIICIMIDDLPAGKLVYIMKQLKKHTHIYSCHVSQKILNINLKILVVKSTFGRVGAGTSNYDFLMPVCRFFISFL